MLLRAASVLPLTEPAPADPALVALGEALFFDKLLSGNMDISCATCHHPQFVGADGRPLPSGTGGAGLGPERTTGAGREIVPRNAPELFNRGDPLWTTMFWDGRVATNAYVEDVQDVAFKSPAGTSLPHGLANPLAVQALFPVTSRAEMRGEIGDVTVLGSVNELALVEWDDPEPVWDLLMARLRAVPAYDDLFAAAYPDTPRDQMTIAHVANAIAAYEIAAFSFYDSPWDRYVAGDTSALGDEARAGALLFYGRANCDSCHNGALLTDQEYYNLAVPQFGPGKVDDGYDYGRQLVTRNIADRFAFRTPPLRNVTLTAPYMHNGAVPDLAGAIRYHLDPVAALQSYDGSHLPPELQATLRTDPATIEDLLRSVEPQLFRLPALTDSEIAQLLAFLEALTSPSAVNLQYLVPESVPSGLPVGDS